MKKIAFTLAEVLITLSILGVIAAISIPNMVNNFRKKQTEVALLRAYTMIEKALDVSQAIYGPYKTWDGINNNTCVSNTGFAEKYILPGLPQIAYKCNYSGTNGYQVRTKCFKDNPKDVTGALYTSGWADYNGASHNAAYRLKNGMSIGFLNGYYAAHFCTILIMTVDINGPDKGKNQFGSDIFFFSLKYRTQVSTIEPVFEPGMLGLNNKYASGIDKNCSINSKTSDGVLKGGLCAAKIAKNGWKIPKDYPVKF